MSRKSGPRRRPPGPATVLGAIAALLAATGCFVGCVAEISALGREHQAPAAARIAASAGFAIAAVVLMRVAIRLEHRFRSAPVPARAAALAARRTSVRHPANGPAARIAGVVIITGAFAFLALITFSLRSQAAQSSYTQHHGLARNATIQAVRLVNHATSTQAWTTYDYDVALAVPVGAVTQAVAHDPTQDFQRFDRGNTISVLVDPRQPDYAELPGIPVESSSWFAGPLVLAVIFAGLAVLIVSEEIRHRRLRSAQARSQAMPEPPGPHS